MTYKEIVETETTDAFNKIVKLIEEDLSLNHCRSAILAALMMVFLSGAKNTSTMEELAVTKLIEELDLHSKIVWKTNTRPDTIQ